MVNSIIKQWEENKHKLWHFFRTTKQEYYNTYEKIVKKIFELVITEFDEYNSIDYENITEIDNGDYQGTQIYIIPNNSYQPGNDDYLVTHNYYGSCSGCDTLLAISEYNDGIPNESQVKEYMTLALHLVQKTKKLEL